MPDFIGAPGRIILLSKRLGDRLNGQVKSTRVDWAFDKFILPPKLCSIVIECVDKYGSDTDYARCSKNSCQGVLK